MNITIELTNACNLRCKYCYQDHKSNNISIKEAECLIDFIKFNAENGLKSLHIHWFGGEPTLNLNLAKYIDKRIKKISDLTGLNYNSSITTNGYNLIEKYQESLWNEAFKLSNNIRWFKKYSRFSRPHSNGMGTFDEIIDSIKYLICNGENIIIRYNVNKTNKNLNQFLTFLKENNIGKNVSLHIQPTTKFELSEKLMNFILHLIKNIVLH